VFQPQFKGLNDIATQVVSAAQRFNIVAALVESVAALVQRFKSVATKVLTKHESFRIYIMNLPSWGATKRCRLS
jgi:hypothetical protein